MSYYQYPWFWPYFGHYPMLPYYDPVNTYNVLRPSYQSMFHQYPHQYYQQQGTKMPNPTTDLAGILGFGLLRWYALRGLMGYY